MCDERKRELRAAARSESLQSRGERLQRSFTGPLTRQAHRSWPIGVTSCPPLCFHSLTIRTARTWIPQTVLLDSSRWSQIKVPINASADDDGDGELCQHETVEPTQSSSETPVRCITLPTITLRLCHRLRQTEWHELISDRVRCSIEQTHSHTRARQPLAPASISPDLRVRSAHSH